MTKNLIESIDNFLTEDVSMGHQHDVKAGDIFVLSYGYDSTNLSWYIVLASSKSQVKLVEIRGKTVRDTNGHSAEIPDKNATKGQPFTRKINLRGSSPSVMIDSGLYASYWFAAPYNGKPVSKNSNW